MRQTLHRHHGQGGVGTPSRNPTAAPFFAVPGQCRSAHDGLRGAVQAGHYGLTNGYERSSPEPWTIRSGSIWAPPSTPSTCARRPRSPLARPGRGNPELRQRHGVRLRGQRDRHRSADRDADADRRDWSPPPPPRPPSASGPPRPARDSRSAARPLTAYSPGLSPESAHGQSAHQRTARRDRLQGPLQHGSAQERQAVRRLLPRPCSARILNALTGGVVNIPRRRGRICCLS